MKPVTVAAEVASRVPAERVFALLTDWPRHAEWMPLTRAEGGRGVGAELKGWTGIGPIGFMDTMVVTEWDEGRRIAVRHTGRLVRGAAWFDTEPRPDGGSTIKWVERLDLPLGPLGRAGWLVVGPLSRRFMLLGLRRLVRLAARTEAAGPQKDQA